MEIRQLNYFIAVAEERHFGRAAKRLHMAQPPLSQQIRQLEEQLGVRLLNRTTRRVELTAAGQALLDRGRQIVNAVGTLRADVYQVGQGASGVLRVGFSGSATYGVMPPIVRRAKQVLPGLSLNLHGEMLTPAMEAGLRDGTLDAALLRPPIASQDIEYRIVTREALIVALPSFSALALDRPVAVHELQDQEFISYPPESVLYRTTAGLCREAGFQPRITQVISETSTMLSFVAAGSGVAILPASVRALQLEGVVYRDIEQAPEVELAVAWRREDRSSLLQSFLDVVGAATKDLPNRTPSPPGS
ncbi:LysR substrate-binding domain-containing protein [Pseudarthrobacter sp. NBSH8]|uniref:LysR substrate-binding domain-containing protein n=1 Tax=Pseudarthrobacter sp. NBSH8 TaxID=2596911 RepID=UPI0016235682|nr:LysR substrate-binding domain-containing protein [Pseudarthrobacter sp. NBSH8]QNE14425.1 LysR family transcriptional regulator [Pseudarthrobacter sp. NBSH8]